MSTTFDTGAVPDIYGSFENCPPEARAAIDFNDLVNRCRSGDWPARDATMSILRATNRSLPELITLANHDIPRKPPAVVALAAPVMRAAVTAKPPSQPAKQQLIANQSPAMPPAVQKLHDDFTANQRMIEGMGVTREMYVRTAMKNQLQKMGVDPSFMEIGTK